MNGELPPDVPGSTSTWLAEGPDRAPSDLLTRLLERSRSTRQRPGWLAVALGTPAAEDRGMARSIALRPMLIALGLLLAAAALVSVSIIGSRNDRLVTVVASPSHTPVPATQPTLGPTHSPLAQTPTPTATATFDASQVPEVYAVADWGITLRRKATMPWGAVEVGFDGDPIGFHAVGSQTRYVLMSDVDQTSRDLFFGACSADRCQRPLITLSLARNGAGLVVGTTDCWGAPPSFVFDCLGSNDLWPVTVSGHTLAALRREWLAAFGDATVTSIRLGGEPAVVLERAGRRTVLAIHGDVLVALITQPLAGSSEADAASALDGVISRFRFDDRPSASSTLPR